MLTEGNRFSPQRRQSHAGGWEISSWPPALGIRPVVFFADHARNGVLKPNASLAFWPWAGSALTAIKGACCPNWHGTGAERGRVRTAPNGGGLLAVRALTDSGGRRRASMGYGEEQRMMTRSE